jgi:hypothetical protein
LDGKIYYVAGQHYHNNDLVPQSDVHRYDPETNMWTQVASLPVERNHMSNTIVVLGGRIIVMGGQYTHETPNDEVFAYDPAADAWTELTSLPIEQFSAIGGVINGEIYYGTGDKGHSGPERRRMRKGIPIFSEAVTATPDLTATATPMVTGEQPTSESTAQPTQTSTPASTPIAGGELLINGSFEAATTGWKGKSLSQDKVKCDKPDKSFAYTGDCAFLFKGGADENARLQQKVDLSTRAFNGGDTLTISFYANVKQSAVNAKVRVMVKFNDATEKIRKEVALAQTSGYQPFSDTLGLPVGNVAAIKVQILHNSPGGKLFIDDLRLNHNALNTTTLLPLP